MRLSDLDIERVGTECLPFFVGTPVAVAGSHFSTWEEALFVNLGERHRASLSCQYKYLGTW